MKVDVAIEEAEINSNIIFDEDLKCDNWSVVKSKKSSRSEKRRQKKEYVSSLAPIFEDVSEDDIYYSSGEGVTGSDEDEDRSDPAKDKNNNKTVSSESRHSKSDVIPFSLRPNSGNRVRRCAVNVAESDKNKPVEIIKRETPCSISLKLSVLEKEEMVMLRRTDRFNSSCRCKEYKNSLPQFLKDFKHRNSVERTLPLLDNYDNQLLQSANSFRTGSIVSYVKVDEESGNRLLINTEKLKNGSKKENDKEVKRIPDLMPIFREIPPPFQTREIPDKSTNSVLREDKCSKLEMSLQETSLKLQNLFDQMESLRLDSNLYFSKMIECFEY